MMALLLVTGSFPQEEEKEKEKEEPKVGRQTL